MDSQLLRGDSMKAQRKGKSIGGDVAEGRVTLTAPAKMPGYSWSIPAGKTCPSARATVKEYGQAAVCASCYVVDLETGNGRGNYRFPTVQTAQARRFSWLLRCLKNDPQEAVDGLVALVSAAVEFTGDNVFRVHDSGDLFNAAYIDVWHGVAVALPDVKFWIPTREYLRDVQLPALRRLASLQNVSVRPSAAVVGQAAPIVDGLSAGTAVALPGDVPTGHKVCPATSTDEASCDAHDCRMCWTKDIPVAYMAHGAGIKRNAEAIERAGRKLPVVA